jgi:hypothetical protein
LGSMKFGQTVLSSLLSHSHGSTAVVGCNSQQHPRRKIHHSKPCTFSTAPLLCVQFKPSTNESACH